MTKHTIDTETSVDHGDNEGKTETNYKNENKTDYGDFENVDFEDVDFKYVDYEDVDLEITCNNTSLPPSQPFPCLAKNSILEDIANIVELDMIQSSSPANTAAATIDQEFLSNVANWGRRGTRDICTRIPEVDRI